MRWYFNGQHWREGATTMWATNTRLFNPYEITQYPSMADEARAALIEALEAWLK